ncbi:hypothetical protein [Pseudomonas sp. NPDC096950]
MPHTSLLPLLLAALLLSGCGKIPDDLPMLATHSTAQPTVAG